MIYTDDPPPTNWTRRRRRLRADFNAWCDEYEHRPSRGLFRLWRSTRCFFGLLSLTPE